MQQAGTAAAAAVTGGIPDFQLNSDNSRLVLVSPAVAAEEMRRHLHACNVLALDTESCLPAASAADNAREELSLVQLAVPAAGEHRAAIYLVDLVALGGGGAAAVQQLMAEVLGPVMRSEEVLKVLHDARKDIQLLEAAGAGPLRSVWDTQVMEAARRLLEGLSDSCRAGHQLLGGSEPQLRVGLDALLQRYDLPVAAKKAVVKHEMQRSPSFWAQRPLSEVMMAYAAGDVACLLALAHRQQLALQSPAHTFSSLPPPPAGTSPPSAAAPMPSASTPASTLLAAAAAAAPAALPPDVLLDQLLLPSRLEAVAELGVGILANDEAEASREGLAGQLSTAEQELDGGRLSADGTDAAGQEARTGMAPVGDAAGVPQAAVDAETRAMLEVLPVEVRRYINEQQLESEMVEVVVDEGREVRLRLRGGARMGTGLRVRVWDALLKLHSARGLWSSFQEGSTAADDEAANTPSGKELGGMFQPGTNWLTLPGTLHRISASRDREGRVIGITYRFGRHVPGQATLIQDVLKATCVPPRIDWSAPEHAAAAAATWSMTANSSSGDGSVLQEDGTLGTGGAGVDTGVGGGLLLIGRPGAGKTTLLRDVAYVLSTKMDREVVVVDTSNEIAGDGRVPHWCIGSSRRLMVREREQQHAVLLEAVQNLNPDVVMCDEIGTFQEVRTVRTTSQRGICMVATTHGVDLASVLRNPDLNPLLGGITTVTLGDSLAAKANHGSKTHTERQAAPAFAAAVEVLGPNSCAGGVHRSVAASVDALLAGKPPPAELRWRGPNGHVMVQCETREAAQLTAAGRWGMAACAMMVAQ